MSKYFYHGVSSISNALKILQSGSLKCRRLLGEESKGYNGLDYISVCKKYDEIDYKNTTIDNAFYTYVQDNCCFIISEEIAAIKTKPVRNYMEYLLSGTTERVSDMFDEWQVYQEIPLSAIVGIGIPCDYFSVILSLTSHTNETIGRIKEIIEIANALGLDIVDSSQRGFAEEYERQKQLSSTKVYQISRCIEGAIAPKME